MRTQCSQVALQARLVTVNQTHQLASLEDPTPGESGGFWKLTVPQLMPLLWLVCLPEFLLDFHNFWGLDAAFVASPLVRK